MTPTRSTSEHGDAPGPTPRVPALTVAAVARRLGVAPATLRTWDRRYGLGPSGRSAGSHRRYTGDDVARLLVMRSLTLEGVAPVDAAQAALEADVSAIDPWSDADGPVVERAAAVGDAPRAVRATELSDAPEPSTSVRPFLRAVPGGGQRASTANGGGRPAGGTVPVSVSDVVDAAIAYDQAACAELLRIGTEGDPGVWWPSLVEPAFRRLAERTVLAGPGEDPVVLLANATLHALRRDAREREEAITSSGGPPANHPSRMRRIVLIFVAPEERLPLAAHALAAALGARGSTAKIVTGPANTHRSLEIVTMVRPAAMVAVTSLQRPELDVVDVVHESNPDLPIFVGLSHDEATADLPLARNVQRVRSFTGLLHEVLAVVR